MRNPNEFGLYHYIDLIEWTMGLAKPIRSNPLCAQCTRSSAAWKSEERVRLLRSNISILLDKKIEPHRSFGRGSNGQLERLTFLQNTWKVLHLTRWPIRRPVQWITGSDSLEPFDVGTDNRSFRMPNSTRLRLRSRISLSSSFYCDHNMIVFEPQNVEPSTSPLWGFCEQVAQSNPLLSESQFSTIDAFY